MSIMVANNSCTTGRPKMDLLMQPKLGMDR
jgi:hypothetical protein